ncbi:N-acyl-D-amino-acid deacylase family protein [Steroidobacter sp.]|uniref:N-acyl-D-amino-acid deacylase family protein n=1 Tax=Steroidobacter sp. TaxID=1978227 RepID=UPI001A57B2DD|nr:D-aminoacylase [Steroidobacter sp.]MBL8271156.1 D-aminoacylase [Steroidobacter sp.]
MRWLAVVGLFVAVGASAAERDFDVIIRGGMVYDGTGAAGAKGDVGVRADRVVSIGDLREAKAPVEIDARGQAVAPGFINLLSQAGWTFLSDARSESDLRQGVTLEILGEGVTMGPLNAEMHEEMTSELRELGVQADWSTQRQYMELIERRGVSPNIASFIGATTIRVHVMGRENRRATPAELEQMRSLVREAMQDGAFGVTSAVQYAPAVYADTDELVALASAAAPFGGSYISHMRSEGAQLLESVDEVIEIAERAKVPAAIYHLKAFGAPNWPKMRSVIDKIDGARARGLQVTANMYPYDAAFTGLDLTMPPWVQEGGNAAWVERLRDPAIRARVLREMSQPGVGWSNALKDAGSPDKLLILGAHKPTLRRWVGKTIGDVARECGVSPENAIVDLVIEEGGRLQVAYFAMSEDNLRLQLRQPWLSLGSDGDSRAAEGDALLRSAHPRDYGTFARVLGKYVREERVISLTDAIHRMSGLPAATLGLRDRGTLRVGNYADIVVFDPKTVADQSTFQQPHRYATGVRNVFVNGVQVIKDGEHTGAKPGRFIRRH